MAIGIYYVSRYNFKLRFAASKEKNIQLNCSKTIRLFNIFEASDKQERLNIYFNLIG